MKANILTLTIFLLTTISNVNGQNWDFNLVGKQGSGGLSLSQVKAFDKDGTTESWRLGELSSSDNSFYLTSRRADVIIYSYSSSNKVKILSPFEITKNAIISNPISFNTEMTPNNQDHVLFSAPDPGNGNYFGALTWQSNGRRRASIVATRENDDTDYVGLAFFTQGTDGPGPMYESMRITRNGNVGIGTTSTGAHKLAVEGSIGAREIKVEANGWSDFVFESQYDLRTLEEVEEHIAENGHLPEIPSEAEVIENGINLGEMNAKLLQKIEELTLYMIEQNKENQKQRKLIGELQEEVSTLKRIKDQNQLDVHEP